MPSLCAKASEVSRHGQHTDNRCQTARATFVKFVILESLSRWCSPCTFSKREGAPAMRSVDLRLLLAAGALLSMAAGATSRAPADRSGPAARLAAAEHFASATPTRVPLHLLCGLTLGSIYSEMWRSGRPRHEA